METSKSALFQTDGTLKDSLFKKRKLCGDVANVDKNRGVAPRTARLEFKFCYKIFGFATRMSNLDYLHHITLIITLAGSGTDQTCFNYG